MRRFTALFLTLDATTRTTEKVDALVAYFTDAPPADAAWALHVLVGRRLRRLVNTRLLREWVADEADLPLWLVEESYDAVGDLAETMALLLPPPSGEGTDAPLHALIRDRLEPLQGADDARKRELLVTTWRECTEAQRLVWNKLITGAFRVGVQRTLVARALGQVAGVDPAVMAHRLMGEWTPTPASYAALLAADDATDLARPYPFYLASPLEEDPAGVLGDVAAWQAEWKWDGIRGQLLRRGGETLLWSRGEELVTDRFPEIVEVAAQLPDGTVLDGEILCWRDGRPLPFNRLQTRINRKTVGPKLLRDAPVVFNAYDLLEVDGEDVREWPLSRRRQRLETIVEEVAGAEALRDDPRLVLSAIVAGDSWDALTAAREEARERGVEGLMLKRVDSPYAVGRKRGDWWKWKIDPYTIDAVLVYAQRGHGRRAGLYTDYTFAVWDGDELVPVAKAYSGLTDAEIREVDRFVRRHTVDRHGPVRVVEPRLVFELAFEAIAASSRHRSGIAVRFPRMARWRTDKAPEEADRLETLKALVAQVEAR